jgi:hypothetical protein
MADPRLERLTKKANQVVKNFSSQHAINHEKFVQAAWPTSSLRKDPSYLAWKYRSDSTLEITNLLLAIHDNQVVGQLGLIPVQVKCNDNVLSARWGCNFKVLETFEGTGYGSLLDIYSMGMSDVTLGASPTKQSEELKVRLGFVKMTGPVKMFYPIEFLYFIEMKLGKLPLLAKKLIANMFQAGFKFIASFKQKNRNKALVHSGSYRDIIDLIQLYRNSIQLPHIVHDEVFLNWRCGSIGNYRQDSGSLYLADGSFILYYPSNSYCYIYECAFKSNSSMKLLLNELIQIASKKKCVGLYVYSNNSDQQTQFKKYGFLRFRERVTVYAYSGNPSVKFGDKFHLDSYDSDGNI